MGTKEAESGAASVKRELQLKESIIKILQEQVQKEKVVSKSQAQS